MQNCVQEKSHREKCALVVIDMQNDFVLTEETAVKGAKATVPAIARAMEICREKNIPVYHVVRAYEQDGSNAELFRRERFKNGHGFCIKGTQGAEIVRELAPKTGDIVLVKPRFSVFFGTSLHEMLKEKHVAHILFAGTQYPNCVRSSAVDALCHDYRVTVLTDCCSAQNDGIAEANVRDLKNMGISCVPFAEADIW